MPDPLSSSNPDDNNSTLLGGGPFNAASPLSPASISSPLSNTFRQESNQSILSDTSQSIQSPDSSVFANEDMFPTGPDYNAFSSAFNSEDPFGSSTNPSDIFADAKPAENGDIFGIASPVKTGPVPNGSALGAESLDESPFESMWDTAKQDNAPKSSFGDLFGDGNNSDQVSWGAGNSNETALTNFGKFRASAICPLSSPCTCVPKLLYRKSDCNVFPFYPVELLLTQLAPFLSLPILYTVFVKSYPPFVCNFSVGPLRWGGQNLTWSNICMGVVKMLMYFGFDICSQF